MVAALYWRLECPVGRQEISKTGGPCQPLAIALPTHAVAVIGRIGDPGGRQDIPDDVRNFLGVHQPVFRGGASVPCQLDFVEDLSKHSLCFGDRLVSSGHLRGRRIETEIDLDLPELSWIY